MNAVLSWSDAVMARNCSRSIPPGPAAYVSDRVQGRYATAGFQSARSLPVNAKIKRAPLHIADGRLLAGLDLSATLLAGPRVAERGLLSEADGGVLMLAMAERLSSATMVHITAAMDSDETAIERDVMSLRLPARLAFVALDEGLDDEFAPQPLLDRGHFISP